MVKINGKKEQEILFFTISKKKKKKERRAKKLSPKVNFKKYLKSEYKLVIFKNVWYKNI